MLQEYIDIIEKENYDKAEELQGYGLKPCVAVINANMEDEPSQRYIRKKTAKMNSKEIDTELIQLDVDCTVGDIAEVIHRCNVDSSITGIILQLPLSKKHKPWQQKILDWIDPSKDIDRLNSCWYYNDDFKKLPLTAVGMFKLFNRIEGKGNKVLFYGNGETTSRRLFLYMFNKGIGDCRIINSKTPKESKEELIEWADIIFACTGVPEILECRNKIIISPTITKVGEKQFRSDLKHDLREFNEVHNIIGGIGKLTVSELIRRAYEDCI